MQGEMAGDLDKAIYFAQPEDLTMPRNHLKPSQQNPTYPKRTKMVLKLPQKTAKNGSRTELN